MCVWYKTNSETGSSHCAWTVSFVLLTRATCHSTLSSVHLSFVLKEALQRLQLHLTSKDLFASLHTAKKRVPLS